MRKQDLLLMLGTFCIGMAVGVYAYFAGYSPVAESVEETVEAVVQEITIVGEAYGGCDMAGACPSFRIEPDGSYRYFYLPQGARDLVLQEGVISRDLQVAIRAVAQEPVLEQQSQNTNPAFCDSFTDGIDVVYEVRIADTDYILNSCGTAVESDSQLWQTLSSIWTYLERAS